MFWHCFTHIVRAFCAVGCWFFWKLTGISLRVIKVNTFEP